MKRWLWIACAYLFLTIPAGFGQCSLWGVAGSVNPGATPGKYTSSYTVSLPVVPRTILAGSPYSGEESSRQTRTLPDGTRIAQQGPLSCTMYRDSAGRVRTERHPFQFPGIINRVESPIVPEIWDPIAGFIYYLDPVNRIAHRMLLPKESVYVVRALPSQVYPASSMNDGEATRINEPLGTSVIDGIEVQGRRITTTYAAETVGNDQPITATTEIWNSPELGFAIFTKTTDPRTGEFTNSIANIRREEPDPALFRVPPSYRIVDELKVPFMFTITIAGAGTY